MSTEDRQSDLLDLSSVGDDLFEHRLDGTLPMAHFATPALNQRLDLLRHLTNNSDKIPLVLAPEGAGKTTLLQQFQDQAHEGWVLCCIEASEVLQPGQLFQMLGNRFGHSGGDAIEPLLEQFAALSAQGALPVIAIDDAHLLPVPTFIALLRLHERSAAARAGVRVLLFAAPQLEQRLQAPQIQAMNLTGLHRLDIPLFDHAQSVAFARFLLNGGETDRDVPQDQSVLERVAKAAQGLPGAIERQVVALQSGQADLPGQSGQRPPETRSLWVDLPRPALYGGLALLLLFLLTLTFQEQINRLFDPTAGSDAVEVPGTLQSGVVPLAIPRQSSLPPEAKTEPTETADSGAPTAIQQPEPLSSSVESSVGEKDEMPSADAVERPPEGSLMGRLQNGAARESDSVADSGASPTEAAGVVELPLARLQVQLEPKPLESLEKPDVESALSAKLQTKSGEQQVLQQSAQQASSPPADSAGVKLPEEKPADTSQSPAPAAQVEVTAPRQSRSPGPLGSAWIRQQKPAAYTLQLIGVGDELAARRFIEQQGLPAPTGYFKTLRNGTPWYSVFHGLYPNREAALRGKQGLPSALATSGAWPRTLGSIQGALPR